MDGTFGTISFRQFTPRRTRPKNPENALKAFAVIGRWTSALARTFGFGQMRLNGFPLFIGDSSPSHAFTPWLGRVFILYVLSTGFGMSSRRIPLRRPGKPEEIGSLAVSLARDEASFVAGEVITISGGEMAQ
jgi:NAD(P)-dependent dehydrogenase (short-subunit alcohol dehydrogenase family)